MHRHHGRIAPINKSISFQASIQYRSFLLGGNWGCCTKVSLLPRAHSSMDYSSACKCGRCECFWTCMPSLCFKHRTCGEICEFFERSSNCNKHCSLRLAHSGPHRCRLPQHNCKQKCCLPGCQNSCGVSIESCHHDLDPNAEHLCGNVHACPEKCEMRGMCEILRDRVSQTRKFQGRRGSFEYEYFSQQSGVRKDCCIRIPSFQRTHQGPHVHTNRKGYLHYCDAQCQACGNFCDLRVDHPGLHNTVHGNMRNVNFVSETEEIDIGGRKYTWGETGIAETCNVHCKRRGRGHIHLVPCPESNCTSKLCDGSRHQTTKYGPDWDVPKDEMTHEAYWKFNGFVDPCTEEEQQAFGLCPHYCRSEEHDEEAQKSFCTETLWHAPINKLGSSMSSAGHITGDGHHFGCVHPPKNVPHHVIFVIDRSGSMADSDIQPAMSKFVRSHNCRLGCVYEAMLAFIVTRLKTFSDDSVSVILFDDNAFLAAEMEAMSEDIIERLLRYGPGGGTTYSSGLELAENVMVRGSADPTIGNKEPFIVFLSDGGNGGGEHPVDCVNRMKRREPGMCLHTVMFGKDATTDILIAMANSGNGTFRHSDDAVHLVESFERLATISTSVKPPVAALM